MKESWRKWENYEPPATINLKIAYAKWHDARRGQVQSTQIQGGGALRHVGTPRHGKYARQHVVAGIHVK